ncbi:MAG: hypothetical protein ACOC5L_04445 [Halobacteriota archaeon]
MKKILSIALASILILLSVILFTATYIDMVNVNYLFGPFLLGHWMAWIGALFIALFTPLYSIFKRKYPKKWSVLVNIHAFGNLIAFILISGHFAQQISKPASIYPDLGTGITLYPIVLILVITGLLQKYSILKRFRRQIRFVHVSIVLSFYLVIVTHILQGLDIV